MPSARGFINHKLRRNTIFIVPMFIQEASSAAIVTKLQAVSAEELTISLWTKAEFSSVLARRIPNAGNDCTVGVGDDESI